MIKNCILYRYSKEFKWEVNRSKLRQCKLEDCLKKAVGFSKPKIKALTVIAKKENISLVEETNKHYIFTASCEFKVPKLLATNVSPFVPTEFKMWLRKKSSMVATFDAGRKLSGVAITLLSHSTTDNPSAIEFVKLDKSNFLTLKRWLLSNKMPGQIKQITMQNIEHKGLKFKQIVLSANRLEDSNLFTSLLDTALIVKSMAFITPPLDSSGRSLSCRLNYWGGLTIYTPNLLDTEISEFIGIFEKIFVGE